MGRLGGDGHGQDVQRRRAFDQDIGGWDVSNVAGSSSFGGFLEGAGLSAANYDALLTGWEQLDLVDGLSFNAGSSQYTSAAASARQAIIDDDGWTITDGGITDGAVQPPTGLSATLQDGQVKLTWEASSTASGYNVYRSTSNRAADAEQINESPVDALTYSDTDVTRGTRYYYWITAFVSGGESEFSSKVQIAFQNLKLIGLEVNQSIQSWENSVPLIEGKRTTVRAHLQSTIGGPTPVNAQLQATRGGNFLATIKAQDSFEAPFEVSNPDIIRNRRANLHESLNFDLPPRWLSGTVTLRLIGDNIDCAPAPQVSEECEITIRFEESAVPLITFFEIHYGDGGAAERPFEESSGLSLASVVEHVEAMYPVERIGPSAGIIEFETGLFRSAPTKNEIEDRLEYLRAQDVATGTIDENQIYFGFTKNVYHLGGNLLGSAKGIGGDVAFAVTSPGDINKTPEIGGTTAHEIGHVLGLYHAVNRKETESGSGVAEGVCGSEADAQIAPDFPYVYKETEPPLAAIGPQGQGLAKDMWGINASSRKVKATYNSIDGGMNTELMSYCLSINAESDDRLGYQWISDITYAALLEAIRERFGSSNPPMLADASSREPRTQTSEVGDDYMLVRGRVNLAKKSVKFYPFGSMTTTVDRAEQLMPKAGDYLLQTLGSNGQVLQEVSFQPKISIWQEISETGSFIIPVRNGTQISEVRVLKLESSGSKHNLTGVLIGAVSGSQNPPSVDVISPNGAEIIAGEELDIEWVAEDADGDSLTYTVQYSRDDGATWQTLNTDWSGTSITVPQSHLGGTSEGLIRVKASDGFNTAQDISDGTFATSNTAPTARIISPSDGAVTDTSSAITLEGRSYDTEDGSLTGSALEWSTSAEGLLGTGAALDLPAAQLGLGTHVITLAATDAGGLTAKDSVTVQVALARDPALVASRSVAISSDGLVAFGGTGTFIDFAGVSGSGAVTVDRYDSPPIGTASIPERNVSDYRILWEAESDVAFGPETQIRFAVEAFGGIGDPGEVLIYYRKSPGNGPFSALQTQVDDAGTPGDLADDTLYVLAPSDGEFVFASDSQPLPVELISFEAVSDEGDVQLTWVTASEVNNAGFEVERRVDGEPFTTIGYVEGAGTTQRSQQYQHEDQDVPYEAQSLTYRLKQVDRDGSFNYSSEVEVTLEAPAQLVLRGNYPNPFRDQTTIRYELPEPGEVRIDVYNVLGQRVAVLADGREEAGRKAIRFEARGLASGVYFVRLTAEGKVLTEKLTIVR